MAAYFGAARGAAAAAQVRFSPPRKLPKRARSRTKVEQKPLPLSLTRGYVHPLRTAARAANVRSSC
jgi:hypothetical protein